VVLALLAAQLWEKAGFREARTCAKGYNNFAAQTALALPLGCFVQAYFLLN